MSKNMSSQPTTSVGIANLLDAVIRLATSPDPAKRTAGWLILAGCFIAYLAGDTPTPML